MSMSLAPFRALRLAHLVRPATSLSLHLEASAKCFPALHQVHDRYSQLQSARSFKFTIRAFSSSSPRTPAAPESDASVLRTVPEATRSDNSVEAAVKDSAFVSLVVRMFGNTKTERTAIRGLAP
jgi:hypothetical protein